MTVDSAAGPPGATIDLGPAAATWVAGWVGGSIVVAPLLGALLGASIGDDLTIPQLAAVTGGTWLVLLAALVVASRRFGTANPIADYAATFRPLDLAGVPLGVLTQLVFVPLLYVPLRGFWPDTFSNDRLERRAQELADLAGGWLTVLLVLVVVVGAPIVEEFVYRGLLQRSVSKATGSIAGLVIVAAWFSLVHFSPVEYPGLFLAGLVFGGCVVVTGRIGPAIVTHAAFNAVGLALVLRSAA